MKRRQCIGISALSNVETRMMKDTEMVTVNSESPFSLRGHTALVTGAGSPHGIGFATARLMSAMGANVLITSTTERIHDRVRELCEQGGNVIGAFGDLTDPLTAPRLISLAYEQFGTTDIVVHNAGMTAVGVPESEPQSIEELDLSAWHEGLARNLDTAFHTAKCSLPAMIEAGWGRMIFVTSVTGPLMAMKGQVAYAAAKAGMVGLARALALDSAAHGVTVNAVAPGWVSSGSQTAWEFQQGLSTPLGRNATTDEIAAAVAWLATPGASYVTGQCLVIDGGNSIAEERAPSG